jgi:hypothetical protein
VDLYLKEMNMNIGRIVSRMSVVSACVSALALSGCLVDTDSAAFEEDMGEEDQAIEPECAGACDLTMEEVELLSRGSAEEIGTEDYESCTDPAVSLAQPDGAAVNLQYPNCGYADVSATSIGGTYDQPLCPHKFVTEVRQVNNRAFQPFVEAIPASTITTESACEGIAITGHAWGFNGSSWVSLGSLATTGIWHPASCGGLFCVPASCQLRFSLPSVSSGFSKVRVAGFAAALGIFKGRVEAGVYGGPGPC